MHGIKKIIVLVGVFFFLNLNAEQKVEFDFAEVKFSDFLDSIVSSDDKDLFTNYYVTLSDETSKKNESKIKATYKYLFEKAFVSLEKEHFDWFEKIKSLFLVENLQEDTQKNKYLKKVQIFLRRYGAYQEFLAIKDVEIRRQEASIGVFASIGEFFSKIGQTFVGWFGFGATGVA